MRLLLAALLVSPVLAQAQPAGTVSTPPEAQSSPQPTAQAVDADDQDVGEILKDSMDRYLRDKGLLARSQRHEIAILQGTAVVQVPGSSPDWVRERAVAYDAALLQAEAAYVQRQQLDITAEAETRFYKAADQTPPPLAAKPDSQQVEMVQKIMAVANGRLDNELRDLGIDPKAYEAAPPSQRYVQLQDSLTARTMRRALGELVGLVPVQTFEAANGDRSSFAIGVIAVVSPAMKDLARQVVGARGQIAPDPTRARDLSQLTSDKAALLGEFGLRCLYDAQGLPVLVSFAQWGSAYRGNDIALAADYREAALQQAEAKADAQIADFLKGDLQYESETQIGRNLEKSVEVEADYTHDEAPTRTMIGGLLNRLRRRAHVQVTGIETLSSWSQKHPLTGQKIVGVVRMWSAAGEAATRQLREQPAAAAPTVSAAAPPSGPATVTQGRDLMNASDF